MTVPTDNQLREFMLTFFSDEEVETFCFVYFPEVKDNYFGSGMSKNRKVMELIGYCQRQGMREHLLVNLEQERPKVYRESFPQQKAISTLPPICEPRPRNPNQVFVSHSSLDADLAHRIASDLTAQGYDIFITPDSIRPGEKWIPAINRGLEESGIFLVLLTPSAVQSSWVHEETNTAIALANNKEARLLLLDVQDCRLPILWQQRQLLSFRKKEYQQNLENLLRELKGDVAILSPAMEPAQPVPSPKGTSDREATDEQRSKVDTPARQCKAMTKSGQQCRNQALTGSSYCSVHIKKPKKQEKKPPQSRVQITAPMRVRQAGSDGGTFIHEKTGLEFVHVPAGMFRYGVGENEEEKYLPEFWISKTPVTNRAYKQFIDANPSYPIPRTLILGGVNKWDKKLRTFKPEVVEHPVAIVSWYDAITYCEWAGLQLPMEEQWEKAARGTDGRLYPWGNNDPKEMLCNFDKNVGGTTPVGRYSPQGDSPYGCIDMSGNVWEWCLNKMDNPKDITFDQSGAWRVLRGGSWADDQNSVRATYRYSLPPGGRGNMRGFRTVMHHPPSQ